MFRASLAQSQELRKPHQASYKQHQGTIVQNSKTPNRCTQPTRTSEQPIQRQKLNNTGQKNLTKIEINENHKLITCDIKDLYVNIPTQETLKITGKQRTNNNTYHHSAGSHPQTKLF